MQNWINQNPDKVMILLFINMVIPPLLLALLGFNEMSKNYLVIIGIGIPWIITTIGQLIYYKKPEEAKAVLDRSKRELDRQYELKLKGYSIIIWDEDYKKAEERLKIANAMHEMHFRLSNILKLLALIVGILFFFSNTIDKIKASLLSDENTSDNITEIRVRQDSLETELKRIKFQTSVIQDSIRLDQLKIKKHISYIKLEIIKLNNYNIDSTNTSELQK